MFNDEFSFSPQLLSMLMRKPWMVFDQADDDKKDDDDKKGGGGGGDDDPKKDSEPKTFTLKIGDTEKVVTLEEMQTLATKSAGADENFRKASEMRKEAEEWKKNGEKGKEVVETFNKLFTTEDYTKADIRKFGELCGLEDEQMEEMFAEELKKAGKKDGGDKTPFKKLKMEDLDDDLQDTIKTAKATQIEQAQEKISKTCKETVDKDEFFGKILKDTDDKQRDDRKAAITDMLHREVNKKILASPYTGEQFGNQMVESALQEVRALIKKFGIPSKVSKHPISAFSDLGLPSDLQTKIQTDEPVDRVPVTDSKYLDTFVARLAQKQAATG